MTKQGDPEIEIRPESDFDRDGICKVQTESFPTRTEADLVNKLRADGDAIYSLVAIFDDRIAGHVLFSRMRSPKDFLGLAPVAVLSSHRRRGIAGNLIRAGLARAKTDGWVGVFVLGDDYYKRFGFNPSLAAGFLSPYAGPHLMALALQPEGMPARTGRAEYARAFSELE